MSQQNREQSRSERAAAVRAEQDRKERNRRIALIVAIVVALGAIVAGGAWYTSGGGSDDSGSGAAQVSVADGAVVVGPADAPVQVIVYEDFQCPYCRQLEDQTRDYLRENAAAGKVRIEYRPINLLAQLPYSERAMNAFAAVLTHSTPQAALKLHDLLFEHQPYESASASITDDDIAKLVAEAGGDNADVLAALGVKDTAFFAAAAQVMSTEGIQGTPTVQINGRPVSGSVPEIVGAIEDAVG